VDRGICGVCGKAVAKVEMCIVCQQWMHRGCSYQKRSMVCSESCSIAWLEAIGR